MADNTPNINFFWEDVNFDLKVVEDIKQWLSLTAMEENNSIGEINIIFCSDEYLLSMNKKHLNHDYFTDIITFQYDKNPISGDLFISIDRVKDNAKQYQIEWLHELDRVMVHGILHLLGYGDKSVKDQEQMSSKENYYLDKKHFDTKHLRMN